MGTPAPSSSGVQHVNPRFNKNLSFSPKFLLPPFNKKSSASADMIMIPPKKNTGLKKSSVSENASVSNRGNMLGRIISMSGTIMRSSRSFFNVNNSAAVERDFLDTGEIFFQKHAKDKWQAEKSAIFKADCADNFPTHIEWRGFNFCISQNTNGGDRIIGQDCMGVASHKDWEVFVLCDGHDSDGHEVAENVCASLPHFILRRIFSSKKKNYDVDDSMIKDAFQECEETVCWMYPEEFDQGEYALIIEGEMQGHVGYIADEDDDGLLTIVIDSESLGYHRVSKTEKEILIPRYSKGGCTCLCLIRNHKTNACKVAVLGDSRMLVLGDIGEDFKNADKKDPMLNATYMFFDGEEASLLPDPPRKQSEPVDEIGFFTPAHDVFNPNEKTRIEALQKETGKGSIVQNMNEGFLVNNETRMTIQPTRGFGDVEMISCGYSHDPEISKTFIPTPNTIIVGGSDGIFDGDIWESDEQFLKYIYLQRLGGISSYRLCSNIFAETVKRCEDISKLDDMSMFVYIAPETRRKYKRKEQPVVIRNASAIKAKQRRHKSMKARRVSIGRDDASRGSWFFQKFAKKKSKKTILDGSG